MFKPKPQFFDIFGALGFVYITAVSAWALGNKNFIPRWALIALFIVGCIGLLVDAAIVYSFYFRKK